MKPKLLISLVCKKCGEEFFHKNSATKHCINCWKPWNRGATRVTDSRIAAMRVKGFAKGDIPYNKLPKVDKKCPICQKIFSVRTTNHTTSTCSIACSYILRGYKRAAEKIEKICPVCQIVFIVKQKKYIPVYCSYKCAMISKERNGKISVAQRGQSESEYTKKQQSKRQKLMWQRPGYREHMLVAIKEGQSNSPNFLQKQREARLKLWQNPEFVRKQMQSRGVRPNCAELNLLKTLEPFGFKYVGDGQLIVAGKCPNYWAGAGRLIELYGDYWHKGEDPQKRIDLFRQHGYDTLVIWERDMAQAPELVTAWLSRK